GLNVGFQLFPNPVRSTLHLKLPQLHITEGKLIIENLSGQMLYTEDLNLSPASRSWQLDVGGWPSGVYVVRLQVGAEQMVRKFVKE
ncbi:T9SS type A sorting domain-containing protein, partial [Phaeodactylibacter xiamenensis]|uniref:T9SS type A sorting domain-containing protein n=1 Tax=Phaeodactylibacter xiamenensis TaxID=1524460 RepID=UPI0024A9B846